MSDNFDEIDRLAALDAEGATPDPDLTDVRARVLAQAADTPARRKGMLIAAGVAAACALLAGTAVAGVAFGRSSAPVVAAADSTQSSSLPLIGMGNGAANPTPAGPAQAPQRNGAAEGGATSGAAADSKIAGYPYFYGNQVFTAGPDVSATSPGTATAYVIDAAGVDRVALAKALAKAFGIKGDPTKDEWGNVTLGSQDGTGPSIYVNADAMASWSFYDPRNDPWSSCVYDSSEPMPTERSQTGGASTDPVPAPDAKPSCNDNSGPDGATSQSQAQAILAKIGVSQDVEWETVVQGPTTTATAWTLVDGMRTQLSSNVTFGADGVSGAYGNAAGVTPINGYPVVSAKEAIDRSADPKWRAFGPTQTWGGGVYPMAVDDMAKAETSASSSDVAAPSTPNPAPTVDGRPVIQVPLSEVVLSGGGRALVQYWQQDGTLILLPGYRFTDAQGGAWDIISVAESAVDFSTP